MNHKVSPCLPVGIVTQSNYYCLWLPEAGEMITLTGTGARNSVLSGAEHFSLGTGKL